LLQRLLFLVLVLQKHSIAITDMAAAVINISVQATDGLHL
jgi:hypothetical protein